MTLDIGGCWLGEQVCRFRLYRVHAGLPLQTVTLQEWLGVPVGVAAHNDSIKVTPSSIELGDLRGTAGYIFWSRDNKFVPGASLQSLSEVGNSNVTWLLVNKRQEEFREPPWRSEGIGC